jgi:hypothetical protein
MSEFASVWSSSALDHDDRQWSFPARSAIRSVHSVTSIADVAIEHVGSTVTTSSVGT